MSYWWQRSSIYRESQKNVHIYLIDTGLNEAHEALRQVDPVLKTDLLVDVTSISKHFLYNTADSLGPYDVLRKSQLAF